MVRERLTERQRGQEREKEKGRFRLFGAKRETYDLMDLRCGPENLDVVDP